MPSIPITRSLRFAYSRVNEIALCGKLQIRFAHANVQGLSEFLNSTERTCNLKICGF